MIKRISSSVKEYEGSHGHTPTHTDTPPTHTPSGMEEGDAHMEELVDPGLGMEETAHGLQRRPSLKESYHSDSMLAPDTDFMTGEDSVP